MEIKSGKKVLALQDPIGLLALGDVVLGSCLGPLGPPMGSLKASGVQGLDWDGRPAGIRKS